MPTRLLRTLMFCAVLSLALTNAFGQYPTPKYWNINPPGTPGNWSVAGNWNPGVVPDFHDWVFINNPGGDYVYLDNLTPVTVDSLTLGSSGATSPSVLFGTGGQDLTINYFLTIGQSGDLELQAGDVVNLIGINVAELTNYGRVHVGPGASIFLADHTIGTVVAGSSFIIEGNFTPQYFYLLDTIEAGSGGVADAQLVLENGQRFLIAPDGNQGGTLTNSGQLILDKSTTLDVEGNVVNNGLLVAGPTGGGTYTSIFGALTNTTNGVLYVGATDTVDVFAFNNTGTFTVALGGALNINPPSVAPASLLDIAASAQFLIYGTFIEGGVSALSSLTSIEGYLLLGNGQTTDITPVGGTLLNSGVLHLANGSTLNVNGDVVNSGILQTVSPGGPNTLNIFGVLTNNAHFLVASGDTANVNYLVNNMDVVVAQGGTLNLLNNTGIPVIPAGSGYQIYGTITAGGQNAFWNLTTNQGNLILYNGQTTNITPVGGTLTNSGGLIIGGGSTLNISGTLTNSGGYSALAVNDAGTVVKVGALNNMDDTEVTTGATLFLLNQPSGITTVAAGSVFLLSGEFYAGATTAAPNGFYLLDNVDGHLLLENGLSIDSTPTGGTLTVGSTGLFWVNSGTTFTLNGTLSNATANSVFIVSDSGSVTNVDTLTNNGFVGVRTGGTLNLTNQAGGITNVVAGSTFDIAGDFIDVKNNDSAFAQLADIHGTLTISNGRTIQDFDPTGPAKTLTIHSGGVFNILNGTTFKVHGNVVGSVNGTINLDPSSLIIEGTLYNNGANINVDGDSAFSVGSVVNGGPLMLTNNAGMTVNDSFYQLAGGTLGESIDAAGFSIIVVNGGPVLLDGTLDILLDPNFNPAVGTFYRFLLFGPGELSGMFAGIQNQYFNNGTEKWIVDYNNAGGYVELQATSAPAPEPASMLLLGSGLLTLGYGARRRLIR